MSGDLKFDKMTVDVNMALTYVASYTGSFHSIKYEDNGKSVQDACNHYIFYADYVRPPATFNLEQYRNNLSDKHLESLSIKLKSLSQNIENRKFLFAQIEYMLRNIKIEETVNIDLQLIVQNLLYVSKSVKKKCYQSNVIVMNEKSPLATLGVVAQMLCAHEYIVIESMPATAVLCHLFTNMCHEVGLDNIRLALVENTLAGANDVTEVKELQSCCVGVVTERSDIDSAIDVFLDSTTRYPWQIRRILVQESVNERLKNVLAWKAKLNPSNKNLDEIKSKCSNIYDIGDKVYLCEYSGDEIIENYVIIEVYRTVKELLSILSTCKPFAVSLWCSDVSESNEIAYGIDSTAVWINDFGCFDGPPKSSQAFYSIIDVSFSRIGVNPYSGIKNLLKVRNNWIKLSDVEKREILNGALKKVQENRVIIDHSLTEIDNIYGNFVEVGNGRACVGLEVAVGEVIFHDMGYQIKDALASIMKGNAVLYRWNDLINSGLYAPLKEAGAPIDCIMSDMKGDWQFASQYSMYKVKVVRTNFGTIFAN